jgi:hypothetical protein
LTLKVENNVWIAADFDFEAKDPSTLQQAINLASTNNSRLLDQFAIELTLQKRRIALQRMLWDGVPDQRKDSHRRRLPA